MTAGDLRRDVAAVLRDPSDPAGVWFAPPASEIAVVAVRFAFEGRVPIGAVTAFVGEPGQGKSAMALELSARASQGELAGDLGGPAVCLYLSAEDAPEHTLVPRLTVAGADLTRVRFLTMRRDDIDTDVTLPDDIGALRDSIATYGARIVVIDPLPAHLGRGVDSHNDHDMRRVLAPLAHLASDLDVAIVVIVHLNKSDAPDVFRRTGGSIGLTAAVRSILVFASDPDQKDDDKARVMVHAKANLAELQPTLTYRTEGRQVLDRSGYVIRTPKGEPFETVAVVWTGTSAITAVDLFAKNQTRRPTPARDAATVMLEELCPPGVHVPVSEIEKEAAARGIGFRTVESVKPDLGIESVQHVDASTGKFRGWSWWLPGTTLQATPQSLRRPSMLRTGEDPETLAPQGDAPSPDHHTATSSAGERPGGPWPVDDLGAWCSDGPDEPEPASTHDQAVDLLERVLDARAAADDELEMLSALELMEGNAHVHANPAAPSTAQRRAPNTARPHQQVTLVECTACGARRFVLAMRVADWSCATNNGDCQGRPRRVRTFQLDSHGRIPDQTEGLHHDRLDP